MDEYELYEDQVLRAMSLGVHIEPKQSKWYWRATGALLKAVTFGKLDFMGKFNSTFGNRIGVSTNWDDAPYVERYATLRHELKHIEQYKRYGFGNIWFGWLVMSFAYLFLPLPVGLAWCRAELEKEAYAETIRAYVLVYDKSIATRLLREFIVNQFVSVNYFWMWPFKKAMYKWFDDVVASS